MLTAFESRRKSRGRRRRTDQDRDEHEINQEGGASRRDEKTLTTMPMTMTSSWFTDEYVQEVVPALETAIWGSRSSSSSNTKTNLAVTTTTTAAAGAAAGAGGGGGGGGGEGGGDLDHRDDRRLPQETSFLDGLSATITPPTSTATTATTTTTAAATTAATAAATTATAVVGPVFLEGG